MFTHQKYTTRSRPDSNSFFHITTINPWPARMSSMKKLIKYNFCCVNFLFTIFGLVTVGAGLWILTDPSLLDWILNISNALDREKLGNDTNLIERLTIPSQIMDPIGYITIAFGAVIFFMSLTGFCGVIKDSRWLLGIYGVLLLIAFISEIVVIYFYFTHRPEIKSRLQEGLKSHYSIEDHPTQFTNFMDVIMIDNRCCGVEDESDFAKLYEKNGPEFAETGRLERTFQKIPEACCHLNISLNTALILLDYEENSSSRRKLLEYTDKPECISDPNFENAYVGKANGCFEKVQKKYTQILVIVGVVVGILQLCGIVFNIFLFKAAYFDYYY